MRSIKLALLATAATAVLSSAAFAADLVVDTPPPAQPVIDNSFPWGGAYIGAFLSGQNAPTAFGLGVDLGVNALMDNLVLGGELEATASTGGQFSTQGTVHLGGVVGDSAMIYAFTGLGTRTTTSFYAPIGAGVEFRLADNLGLKTEAQYNWNLGGGTNSAAAKVGLNWHF